MIATAANLNAGNVQSCGCLRVFRGKELHTTHGESKTKLFRTWTGMFTRCNNERAANYPVYGGRGISVCAAWGTFEQFRDWANANGYEPGLHINRKDNDGNYEAANCEWITGSANQRNRRNQSNATIDGETKMLVEWAEDKRCLVPYQTLFRRMKNGWLAEDAISLPPRALKPAGNANSRKGDAAHVGVVNDAARPGRRKGSTSTFNPRLSSKYWSMRNRCYRAKNVNFANYGGKGVRVCDEWLQGYSSFRDWANANSYEDGFELHRTDSNGDYSPENCRWVTPQENQNTRTNNLIVLAWGEEKTLAEWARDSRSRASASSILYRLSRGWIPERAISTTPA